MAGVVLPYPLAFRIQEVSMQMLMKMLALITAAGFCLLPAGALAQGAYPNRIVKIVVPFAAGGGTDLMARNIAQQLTDAWKQPVVVENRTGAGGIIGADAVAKSPPDGYTYLMGTTTTAINASLVTKPPYDLKRDLQPVTVLGLYALVAVVPASMPVRSMQELIALSRTKSLSAGSGGNGTPQHLVLEMFNGASGVKILHVPYKGGGPAIVGLLGGQIDIVFSLSPECLPHVKSGKLRALAVSTPSRYALMPDIPTMAEAGLPAVQATGWTGLMVPSGTPKDIVAKINADLVGLMSAPEMRARLSDQGFTPVSMSVAETEKFVGADVDRWAKVIRDGNIKSE
jgi:tripartite-type tricarboxylate transporter receptor subunit TctC